MSTYYSNQLAQVNVNSEYSPTLKIIGGEEGQTKWMNINEESASILIDWLSKNFVKSSPAKKIVLNLKEYLELKQLNRIVLSQGVIINDGTYIVALYNTFALVKQSGVEMDFDYNLFSSEIQEKILTKVEEIIKKDLVRTK